MRIGTFHRVATLFAAPALAAVLSAPAAAQGTGIGAPPPPERAARMLAEAEMRLKDGEAAFARGDFSAARSRFDEAVDAFLDGGYDIRSSPELQAAYRNTVERVHRFETIGVNAEGDTVWPMQAYEATSEDFRPEDVPTDDQIAAAQASQFRNASFLVRLGELQRRFRSQFGREFVLTGRDTHAHTRLYGHGKASDVRVHDLSRPQVRFIVDNARALSMRVLDFSSADRVAAHNARVMSLGRPLDTLATGVHLHLNDVRRAAPAYAEKAAAKQRVKSGDK
jgi:hypothetical protein